MADPNTRSSTEEPVQQDQDSGLQMEAQGLSQRMEALENSMRYLEDNMMSRLSTLEDRVEELMRRMDGFSDLNRRLSGLGSLELPGPNASLLLSSSPAAAKPKNKQGMLTARRLKRRYQRLVKPNWYDNFPIRRAIRKLERKKRQRT